MLGEKKKEKQKVSELGNDESMHIDWLNFFYCNRDWTRACQSVVSNELLRCPIEQN